MNEIEELQEMQQPKMYFGDDSRLGRPFAKDPSVIRFGGRYLLYYSLHAFAPERQPADGPKGWGIGIAESRDLDHWKKIGEVLPTRGTIEENGICAPGAKILNGKVHLLYQTYGGGPKDAICHAVSSDGTKFQSDTSNPIFRPNGAWNIGRAIDAEVFEHNGKLLLFYATRDPAYKIQMLGVAEADIRTDYGASAWKNLSTKGPILKPELPWERDCIEAATLCKRGDTLYMFYAGGYNNAPQQIGVATSKDGVNWKRMQDTPILANGAPGSWNESESGHPGIFVDDDGATHLFFQGNNDRGKTWFLSRKRIEWKSNGVPVPVD